MDAPEVVSEDSSYARFGTISDVNATARDVFFRKTPLNIFFIAIAVILFAVGGGYMYLTYITLGTPDFQALFFPMLGAAVLLIRYGILKGEIAEDFLKQMAQELGYSYADSAPIESVSGATFSLGHDQRLTHVISGTYREYPIRIFDLTYEIGYGKNRRDYTETIFELDVGKKMPHIFLNATHSEVSSDLERVRLEGNFDDYFELYAEHAAQMEVRELFTPDVMQTFVDRFQGYRFEISATKLYVVHSGSIVMNRVQFIELRNAVDGVFDTLFPGLTAIAGSSGEV